MKEHYFDVTLRNPSSEPRWLLLPETFPYAGDAKPAVGDGPLAELQVFQLSQEPRTIIAEAVGSNFWALRLPGNGTITVRRLHIASWWETLPADVVLELVVASDILVGGDPFATCFSADPLSASGADVLAPRDAADPRALRFWHPSDRSPAGNRPGGKQPDYLPVVVGEVQRERVRVPICNAP